jgi:hypothetical protein
MTIPNWITDPGSLETIEENLYFEYQLSATGTNVKFKLQAGHFPPGITITEDGLINGTPYMVDKTILSTFVIRAYDSVNEEDLYDRTFSLTVEGADVPFFITTASTANEPDFTDFDYHTVLLPDSQVEYGTPWVLDEDSPEEPVPTTFDNLETRFIDESITSVTLLVNEYSGVKINYQIEYSDPDINQALTIRKSAGDLPPGLFLDDNGLISGIVPLLPGYSGELAELYDDGFGYDMRGYDRSAISPGYDYVDFYFTLEISDGTNSVFRSFVIRIKEPPLDLPPVIMQDDTSIGTYRHDNYFEYKFKYYDVFNEAVTWNLVTITGYGYDILYDPLFPNGHNPLNDGQPGSYDVDLYDSTAYEAYPFQIDPESGVLHSKISELIVDEKTYSFIVRATKSNGAYTQKVFTVTFLGDKNKDLIWLTNAYLGSLNTGENSYFHIETFNSSNLPITYKYQTGNLPEGLTVMPSGAISGRVKFGSFRLDDKSTTVDAESTTFDRLHKFTVRAYSDNDYVTETTTSTTYFTQNFTGDGVTKTFLLSLPTIIDNLVVTDNGVNQIAQDIKNDIMGDFKLKVKQITFFTAPTASHSILVSIPTTTTTTTKTYLVDQTQEYQITIDDPYIDEYTNIYCEALIKQSQRHRWNSILNDTKIFPAESLYYADDASYALPKKASFILLAGLELKYAYEFLTKMSHNFYKKTVVIGNPATTTAYDPNTKKPVYEVIYLPVYDDLENTNGDSVSSSLDLSSLISYYPNGTIAYPNSFQNMQNRINDITSVLTYVTRTSFSAFPLWMKPLYPNLLNNKNPRETYKRAIPIAYVKVGESARILFNIKNKKIDFKKFSFEVQRLTIDNIKGTTFDLGDTTLNVTAHTDFDNHIALLPNSMTVYGTPWVLDKTSPLRSNFTTFDGLGTRFIHEEITLDKGDPPYKYIRFPDVTIFD